MSGLYQAVKGLEICILIVASIQYSVFNIHSELSLHKFTIISEAMVQSHEEIIACFVSNPDSI